LREQQSSFPILHLLGVPFAKMTMEETLQYLEQRLDQRQPTHIITANPEIVMYGNRHPAYLNILHQAEIVVPDGIGIVIASKKWGKAAIPQRVAGFDLLVELLKLADHKGKKVFLLGASEDTNNKAFAKLQKLYPHAKLVGRHHGYFQEAEEKEILDKIKAAAPDMLFVALGFPKQEEWIAKYRDRLDGSLMMGVGGSLDVLADKVKRAPMGWQKVGLEWLYRLLQEPKRWRRMIVLPLFLLKAWLLPKSFHQKRT